VSQRNFLKKFKQIIELLTLVGCIYRDYYLEVVYLKQNVKHSYEPIIGIWVKAKPEYIETFIENWENTKQVQAFCVYDVPPILPEGGLVFLHAINLNRLMAYAEYVGYEYIEGWYEHVRIKNDTIWIKERERIWNTYGPNRLHTHDKEEFNDFWEAQKGVRGLFLMRNIFTVTKRVTWDESMKILQVSRPVGFSYKYLTISQVQKFLQLIDVKMEIKVQGITSPKVILKPIINL